MDMQKHWPKPYTDEYTHSKYGVLRVIMHKATIWFVLVDVVRALEYNSAGGARSLCKRVKLLPKNQVGNLRNGSRHGLYILPKTDLDTLVCEAKSKANPEMFGTWIENDVIPRFIKNSPGNKYLARPIGECKTPRTFAQHVEQSRATTLPQPEAMPTISQAPRDTISILDIVENLGKVIVKAREVAVSWGKTGRDLDIVTNNIVRYETGYDCMAAFGEAAVDFSSMHLPVTRQGRIFPN